MTTSHGTLSVASAPAVHGTRSGHGAPSSPFRQPTAVWAVAFACVVSFMGLGLVDPILPDIARQLHATPSQTELVFTSYLLITAVAMLVTGWVSSRIGAKRTLVAGLLLIVAFSAHGASGRAIAGFARRLQGPAGGGRRAARRGRRRAVRHGAD